MAAVFALSRVSGWLCQPLLAACLCVLGGLAHAQTQTPPPAGTPRSMGDWLQRVHAAPRQHSYIGTVVVSSHGGGMASARIWHAYDGGRQVERVDTLTGPPRSTVRHEDRVVTMLPDQKLVRIERHDSLGRFPDLLRADVSIAEFYVAKPVASDRVAGFEADVVHLAPKDDLRFGYRIWTERRSGLVLKLQTLASDGSVLEQSAFSELQLDVALRPDRLIKMMTPPAGWRVERYLAEKTTAVAEGWILKPAVAGFQPIDCYRRGRVEGAMQCVFSDGLASVSLFVEPFDALKPVSETLMSAGATHTMTRRLQDWRVTAVGEVPPQTLRTLVQSLERRP